MARYIDADKLLEILNEELLYESSMFSQEQEEYLRRGLRIAINDVKRFPAEDVVPKSEVAKEIFAELDKIMKPQERYLYCNPSLTYVYEMIEELKKKYTESEDTK